MWIEVHNNGARLSRYTYRCVVLPDLSIRKHPVRRLESQCTYRCVVLPDSHLRNRKLDDIGLNAPTGAWCSLTPAGGTPSGEPI